MTSPAKVAFYFLLCAATLGFGCARDRPAAKMLIDPTLPGHHAMEYPEGVGMVNGIPPVITIPATDADKLENWPGK